MTITREKIEKFKCFLIEDEKSSATIEKYIHDVTTFFTWLIGCKLDKLTVLRYKEYLTGNYAPASVNSILSSLNSFFEYNEWHGLKVKMLKIQKQIFAERSKELKRQNTKDCLRLPNKRETKDYIILCRQFAQAVSVYRNSRQLLLKP